MKLVDDAFRRRIAEKIAEGLEGFVRIAGSLPPAVPPIPPAIPR